MRARLGRLATAVSFAAVAVVAGCGDDDGDLEAFCAAATDTARFRDVFDGFEPEDIESSITTVEQALDTERELRADAPDAVRPDIDVLIRFFEDLLEGLEAVEPDTDERPAIYDELLTRFDQVEAASTRITTYVEANC